MNSYVIGNYLDISTSHIPESIINDSSSVYHISSYAEGAFFWVPAVYDEIGDEPEELKIVLKYAQNNECTLIRFDCDSFTVPELPQYEW